jgi:hypothetical protein
MSKKIKLKTLEQIIEKHYGKKGTAKRDEFERDKQTFKLNYFTIQQTRIKK